MTKLIIRIYIMIYTYIKIYHTFILHITFQYIRYLCRNSYSDMFMDVLNIKLI